MLMCIVDRYSRSCPNIAHHNLIVTLRSACASYRYRDIYLGPHTCIQSRWIVNMQRHARIKSEPKRFGSESIMTCSGMLTCEGRIEDILIGILHRIKYFVVY